jgi:DNA transformation protein
MARNAEFVRHVLDLMASLGAVRARAMFGGHGIDLGGTTFAIVVDDRLYFKTDAATRAGYEELGLGPFTYLARGKRVALQYHEAPPEVLESAEVMRRYSLEALGVARRARTGKK